MATFNAWCCDAAQNVLYAVVPSAQAKSTHHSPCCISLSEFGRKSTCDNCPNQTLSSTLLYPAGNGHERKHENNGGHVRWVTNELVSNMPDSTSRNNWRVVVTFTSDMCGYLIFRHDQFLSS